MLCARQYFVAWLRIIYIAPETLCKGQFCRILEKVGVRIVSPGMNFYVFIRTQNYTYMFETEL